MSRIPETIGILRNPDLLCMSSASADYDVQGHNHNYGQSVYFDDHFLNDHFNYGLDHFVDDHFDRLDHHYYNLNNDSPQLYSEPSRLRWEMLRSKGDVLRGSMSMPR
jgi:hypothetical protein